MMKHLLLDIPLPPAALDRLAAIPGLAVHPIPPVDPPRAFPTDLLRAASFLFTKNPPTNFADAGSLQLLQLATVGYEHWREHRLQDRGIRICNARGVFDTAIAEWNVAMMIALRRDLPAMQRNQQASQWVREPRFALEVRNKVVGLWGYGGIGRETARLSRALGMTVHVLTRSPIRPRQNTYTQPGTGDPDGSLPHRLFRPEEERDFLAGLDFLILALPHTQASRGLIGPDQLRTLKPSAFLLNPARGPIVQEAALVQALREGWIAGAALDTHYVYPLPTEHPLWTLPNVILTPHISGSDRSDEYPGRIADLLTQNVERFLAGQPLLNELTRAELDEA
jgi:phosphoglycerate dehydrogenase-like enzyme